MSDFTLKIGDKEYPAKRVNLATLKKYKEFLKRCAATAASGTGSAEDGVEGLFDMAAIVHACIQRARPEVTIEEIEEELDQETLLPAFNQVMTGSGFSPSGESKPASSQT